jgi:hypothetical protein
VVDVKDGFRRPARYFPVVQRPYQMEVGLSRLGTDFGNGAVDRHFFQVDAERQRYLRAKREAPAHRYSCLRRGGEDDRVHAAVIGWIRHTVAREHPEIAAQSRLETYEEVSRSVQEDFAVVHLNDRGESEMAAVYVGLPSGWRPERVIGASFAATHGPVPDFADRTETVDSMVRTMIERGPYVRFVWTISADDNLDHHPEEGRRTAWSEGGPGWLRVERQVTVPFAVQRASLFLIRVYLYPFDSLDSSQRDTLAVALESMPAAIQRYKGLSGEPRRIALALLRGG